MQRVAAISLTAFAMLCPRHGMAHIFTGRVERVIDGDTIIVGTNRVRLAEIDAPEMKEPYGQEAKVALSDMILHRTVVVTWKHRGRYRRIIGQVYLDKTWVNMELVARGAARRSRRYAHSEVLIRAEEAAKSVAVGIWANAAEIPEGRSTSLKRPS